MKVKKEYVILVLVIVALVFYLTLQSANHEPGELPQPARVESADIDRMVVSGQPDGSVELVKKDEKWFIQPQAYPADTVKVKNMANAAAQLTLTALVSESGSYERYGLAEGKRITVDAFRGSDAVRRFHIGEPAPTFQHTFVLIDGDPNVYHARGQLKRTFEHTIADLRDKTILDLSRESIATMTLSKGDRTIELTKKEIAPPADETQEDKAETPSPPPSPKVEWHDAHGQVVAKEEVDALLNGIARLNCDGYLDDTVKDGLGAPRWQITLKDDQGEYAVQVFAPENDTADKIPAASSATPYPFVLNKSRVENFEKSIDKLMGIEEAGK